MALGAFPRRRRRRPDEVRELRWRIPVTGWGPRGRDRARNGIAATHVNVLAEATTVVRTAAHIAGSSRRPACLTRSPSGPAVFTALAPGRGQAPQPAARAGALPRGRRARRHRRRGRHLRCAELLGVDEIHASLVVTGIGMIRSAHGALPNPPPAVVELLRASPAMDLDLPDRV